MDSMPNVICWAQEKGREVRLNALTTEEESKDKSATITAPDLKLFAELRHNVRTIQPYAMAARAGRMFIDGFLCIPWCEQGMLVEAIALLFNTKLTLVSFI